MKIVKQLADWLLRHDRITPEYCQSVMGAILRGVCEWWDEDDVYYLAKRRQEERDREETINEEWWNLRVTGGRNGTSRRRGGRKAPPDTQAIKVYDLDPLLPDMLLPQGAGTEMFPLAFLLLAVDKARGNQRSQDWAGFAAATSALYKLDAEELHDAFLAAMKTCGNKLGIIVTDAEYGHTLFPDGFLSRLSGESVSALRKRVDGEETAFFANKKNWILRYPSFNVINEACLVRNRLRRIYRLWVKNFAECDIHGTINHGMPGILLAFGKTLVPVPADIWWKLQDPAAPRLGSIQSLDGSAWRHLLVRIPQLAVFWDRIKLDDDDWEALLPIQPQLSVYRPDKTP